jgi:serine/threonine protein kinase
LGQALKALAYLHGQMVPHGHLSPESLLIEDTMLGPHVKLAWTPGQRRSGVPATLGFRGPGSPGCPAGDIWAIACVVLAWWSNFEPASHPWTQFARSSALQKDIRDALVRHPPDLPKVLLDLHMAITTADEPLHSFLANLANLLTMCLVCQPDDRPSAVALLEHAFFEQAL